MTDRHHRGIELLRRGVQCGRRNEMESGVLCLVEGLGLLDEQADPRLTLSALHNLALYLTQLGFTVLARAVIVRSKPLYRRVGDPVMLARLLWIEGSVARREGRRALAAGKLGRAYRAFREIDQRQAGFIREELELVEQDREQQAA